MKYLVHSTALLCLTDAETPILSAVQQRLGGLCALIHCLDGARLSHTAAALIGLVPLCPDDHDWERARGASAGTSAHDRLALVVAERRGMTLVVEDVAVAKRSCSGRCCDLAELVRDLHGSGGLFEPETRKGAVVLLSRLRPTTPAREALIARLLAA